MRIIAGHRFGHSRQKSNYLIAADVYEIWTTICCANLPPEDLTTCKVSAVVNLYIFDTAFGYA
ncbi:hypothetical protein [aff. Roholtiella sp. LEGE 12411]|uniref:hypothetical protein n=1 Tax=aff. Roholtiella sp. LEGE 12411 TaxID=1828822 RepID=UPI00188196F9|nr:hypothetical protein [aff. Roholtiella sp. LEGE 12411]MBE9035507.1 hypothetical protein [aff. Roholtiella sp. LEGE 12411]